MRDVDDADARGREPAYLLEEAADVVLGDGGGGLVHHDDAGVLGDRLGDLDLLLLGDRQVPHERVGGQAQVQGGQQLLGPTAHGAAVGEDGAGAQLAAQEDVLVDGGVQDGVELLVDHGDSVVDRLAGRGDGDRLAVDPDGAGVGGVDAHEDLHEGGLAGAILPHEGVDLAGAQVEGDGAQDADAGERLVDVEHLENGGGHGRPSATASSRDGPSGGGGR